MRCEVCMLNCQALSLGGVLAEMCSSRMHTLHDARQQE